MGQTAISSVENRLLHPRDILSCLLCLSHRDSKNFLTKLRRREVGLPLFQSNQRKKTRINFNKTQLLRGIYSSTNLKIHKLEFEEASSDQSININGVVATAVHDFCCGKLEGNQDWV